jgi:type I site-specific restriction-modification system R (restriction) subunit
MPTAKQAQTQDTQAQGTPQVKIPDKLLALAMRYQQLFGGTLEDALAKIAEAFDKGIFDDKSLMPLSVPTKPGSMSEKIQDWVTSLMMLRSASGDGKDVVNVVQSVVDARIRAIEDKVNALLNTLNQTSENKLIDMIRSEVTNQLKPIVENMNKMAEVINKITNDTETRKVVDTIKPLIDTLADAIKKINDRLDSLEARINSMPQTPQSGSILDEVQTLKKRTEELKTALEALGMKVVEEKLTKEDVEKLVQEKLKSIPDDVLAKIAQERGYRIVGGPMPYDKVEEIVKEAYRRGVEEGRSDKNAEMLGNLLRDGLKSLFEIIGPGLQEGIKSMFRNPAAAANALNTVANIAEAASAASSGNLTEAAKKITEAVSSAASTATGAGAAAGGAQ